MDDRMSRLVEKLNGLIEQAAATAVELSRADDTVQGVPHYSVIELHAHEVGRQLSRQIQQQQMNEVAAAATVAPCPTCGRRYELHGKFREVASIDGELTLQENASYCSKCRRSFFPATAGVGV